MPEPSAASPPAEPRAILLDLDDTIVDFSGGAEACWLAACEAARQRFDGFDPAALVEAINRRREWYWSDPDRHREGRRDLRAASALIVAAAFVELDVAPPADEARAIANDYRDRRDDGLSLIPGAVDAVERLRARGLRTALVTNGTAADQRAKIERFDLARLFDHVQIEGEFGAGKPEERVYRAALDALDVRPEQAWFAGDNLEWDVAAPQRLGMYGVWVDHLGHGLPPDPPTTPDRTVRALAELA